MKTTAPARVATEILAEEQGEAELALALQHIAIDETGEDGDPEEEDQH